MIAKVNDKIPLADLYKEGDFIDAKDNQGDWRVGYILAKNIEKKTFKLRFDGWASKYDEVREHRFRSTIFNLQS